MAAPSLAWVNKPPLLVQAGLSIKARDVLILSFKYPLARLGPLIASSPTAPTGAGAITLAEAHLAGQAPTSAPRQSRIQLHRRLFQSSCVGSLRTKRMSRLGP